MKPQALIFDYGNVLDYLDDPRPWQAVRDRLAARLGMTGAQMWQLLYYTDPWQKVKRGQISVEEYRDLVLRPYGVTDRSAQAQFFDALFEHYGHVNPQMASLLHELKPNYRLAILSNTDKLGMAAWLAEEQGLHGIFEVVISSAEVGYAKPEPEIYHLTLRQLALAPNQALFIDDLPRNTAAAEVLGLPSIVFESPTQLRQELQLRGILNSAESHARERSSSR